MKSKKFLAAATCAAILAAPTAALADSTDVNLYLGNAKIGGTAETGQVYISDAGRAMVPLRLVGDVMGYTTDWQPDGSIHITSADGTVDVTLAVDKAEYTANGTAGTFGTVPTLKDNRTYLPVRDFGEIYGSVYWDNDSRSVIVLGDNEMEFNVFGDRIFRVDAEGLHHLTLPAGYELTEKGVAMAQYTQVLVPRTFDGTTYMTVNYDGVVSGYVPLFRVDGDQLTYVTRVNGGANYCVGADGRVYYTEALGAGAWTPGEHPSYLYVTQPRSDVNNPSEAEKTDIYNVGFAVNQCDLTVTDGQLYAVDPEGNKTLIDLSKLTPVTSVISQQ